MCINAESHAAALTRSHLQQLRRNATSSRYTLFDAAGPVLSTRPGKWDSRRVSNPAAVIYPNGSVLLAYRGNGEGRGGVGIAVAPHWKGPYTHLYDQPLCKLPAATPNSRNDAYLATSVSVSAHLDRLVYTVWGLDRAVSGYAEDPTLYLDANGIIHMIAHGVCEFVTRCKMKCPYGSCRSPQANWLHTRIAMEPVC